MDTAARGLRVLVTAGAAGIGCAIAETFARAGAHVFVCDVDASALVAFRGAHPAMGAVACDVANPAEVDVMFGAVAAHLGGLDVLVNNAGISGPTAPVEDISVADWDRTIAVDLNSMFYCTRRAVPLLKAAGGGSIVNLSSIAGRLGYALRTPYSSAKWAVVGFTKSLAIELGPANIRVNAIQPGLVEGERIDRVIAAKAASRGVPPATFRDELLSAVAMRKMVTAQEIADMALFLATPAGASISGQAISVCGGAEYLK